MLKRRRTQKLKRNVIYSTATRRRVMLRKLHKKIIWRRRMFAMQQMAETLANGRRGERCRHRSIRVMPTGFTALVTPGWSSRNSPHG